MGSGSQSLGASASSKTTVNKAVQFASTTGVLCDAVWGTVDSTTYLTTVSAAIVGWSCGGCAPAPTPMPRANAHAKLESLAWRLLPQLEGLRGAGLHGLNRDFYW